MERRVGDHKPLNLNGARVHDAFFFKVALICGIVGRVALWDV
jgi:hypothetical protein